MSNSIGSIGGNSSMMMQSMRGMKRPDPAEMANDLFSKLDTSGQGYIQKSDLQAALDKMSSSTSGSSSSTPSVDDMFSQLDGNKDGKVTKSEFSDKMKQLTEQLDSQFNNMRMGNGMPPPGMGGGMGGGMSDAGFTKDELKSQLDQLGSSNSTLSSQLTDIVNNFDKADTDGDGKVSFMEAMAYDKANDASKTSSTSSASSGDGNTSSSSNSADDLNAKLALQLMRLMQAYDIGGETKGPSSSHVSTSA
jgi:Ca2+-binding EF-hand superfamily protein